MRGTTDCEDQHRNTYNEPEGLPKPRRGIPEPDRIHTAAWHRHAATIARHRLKKRNTTERVGGDGDGMPLPHLPLLPHLDLLPLG